MEALKSDGTVWTWGCNAYGELGDGTTTDRYAPAQVPGLSGVTTIAARDYHNIVIKSDGTLWTWGWNINGQLGIGSVTPVNGTTPVAVVWLTVPALSFAGILMLLAGLGIITFMGEAQRETKG